MPDISLTFFKVLILLIRLILTFLFFVLILYLPTIFVNRGHITIPKLAYYPGPQKRAGLPALFSYSYPLFPSACLHRLFSLVHISAQGLLGLLGTQCPLLQHIVNVFQLIIAFLPIHLRQFLLFRLNPGHQGLDQFLLGRNLFFKCLSRSSSHIYLFSAPCACIFILTND